MAKTPKKDKQSMCFQFNGLIIFRALHPCWLGLPLQITDKVGQLWSQVVTELQVLTYMTCKVWL